MTDSLPAPPELDPAALAASEFSRTRRGLEATEVRAVLGRAADALRTWEERDQRLREQIGELEARLDESHELDEQRIATVLGEETARIVTAARDAATEIRTKAEDQAARLIRESEEQATSAAAALEGEARRLRDEAAELHAEAVAEVAALRAAAAADAALVREAADSAAAIQREEAAALATTTVSDAQSRADDLLSAAELVLSERTTEAEAAAKEITDAAAAEAAAAEAAAAATRSDADAYAEQVRSSADVAAEDVRAAAELAAASLVDEATERGRAMVAEARAVRERMLRDLAEKRRSARRQLEGALAGRDRVIEVLRGAGDEVAATIAALEQADEQVSASADAAAAAVDADLDAEMDELRSELSEDDTFHGGQDGAASPDASALEAVAVEETEVVAVEEIEAVEETEVVAVEETEVIAEVVELDRSDAVVAVAADTSDGAAEPTAGQDAADELAAPPEVHASEGHDGDGHDGDGATVHDLFARIRAEGLDEDAAEVGGGAAIDLTIAAAGAADSAAGATDSAVVTEVAVAEATVGDAGDALFDRRDEVLLPIEKGLARVLKRVASDEQNEILDRLRRVKRGRPDPAEILPAADAAPFVEALQPEFARAVGAGARFWAELAGAPDDASLTDDSEVHEELTVRVSEFLALHRAHLERTFADADEADLDTGELGDRVRATYRDWRSGSLADLAGDLATAGFTLGERRAAGSGTPWRWVVDHGGLPCADGEDNALAGDVACGEPFPTGDVTPPAHPGCRCILAPASR